MAVFALVASVAGPQAAARTVAMQQTDDPCAEIMRYQSRDQFRFCEVREYRLPVTGAPLTIDASPNGGISVTGGQAYEVVVRVKVVTTAQNESAARALAQQVQVQAAGSRVESFGPRTLGGENWSVSYDVSVPGQSALSLATVNGGLSISGVQGEMELATRNGGIKLTNVAGRIHGRTINGGISVELDENAWHGEGLDVETRNGGITLKVPRGYNANLEAGTVNGRISTDLPLTVQGQLNRRISTQLGAGGAMLRAVTTNGGITISQR
jgi:hypothetical protein